MLRASTPLFYTGQTSPVWPYTVQEEVNPPTPTPQEVHCFKCEFCIRFAGRFAGSYPWRKTRSAYAKFGLPCTNGCLNITIGKLNMDYRQVELGVVSVDVQQVLLGSSR